MNMNEELKRRITESEHTKEKLEDLKVIENLVIELKFIYLLT